MTTVRSQETLKTISDVTRIVDFIQEHGDKLGAICGISDDSAQINGYDARPDTPAVASALITWFYLLDQPRLDVSRGSGGTNAHITVHGKIEGIPVRAYTSIYGTSGAYLLGLTEPSVHSLRRVQIGDVPEVVAA